MASVLCTGVDQSLLTTRRLILERAGHQVTTAHNEQELIAACTTGHFDVAVVGQTVTPRVKRRVLTLLREQCPGIKVLELFTPSTGRELADADDWLLVPAEVPADLAQRVAALASQPSGA